MLISRTKETLETVKEVWSVLQNAIVHHDYQKGASMHLQIHTPSNTVVYNMKVAWQGDHVYINCNSAISIDGHFSWSGCHSKFTQAKQKEMEEILEVAFIIHCENQITLQINTNLSDSVLREKLMHIRCPAYIKIITTQEAHYTIAC